MRKLSERKKLVRTRVTCVKCGNCGDLIYSRARHDFHYCRCEETFVDGGFDYMRVGSNFKPTYATKYVNATKAELYDDWNNRGAKFGNWSIANEKSKDKTRTKT